MAGKRAGERDIELPAVVDAERRAACEADVFLFLKTYWPEKFVDPWTDDQKVMIAAILHCARFGGDRAIAAPRGGGKSAVFEGVIAYCMLLGILTFPLIIGANATEAARVFENIKRLFDDAAILAEDFPEVCTPILALEGAPARGNMQTVGGQRTHIRWSSELVVLPTVEGSKASGAVLMYRGLDSAIRGIRYNNRRPDLVGIDDPETQESARSEYQVAIRERKLDSEVAGLGGPGKKIGRVMLCTCQNRYCLAYRCTDRKIRPSWKGQRFRFLVTPPKNGELWDKYLDLMKAGQEDGHDEDGREAMAHYIANQQAMEDGAEVSCKHRYIKDALPDGSPVEISPLQNYYNLIHRNGPNFAKTELDNDPPEEASPATSGITDTLVRSRLNLRPRGMMPNDTQSLTAFIDVGDRELHWAVVAWQLGATGLVIDYDIEPVNAIQTYGDQAIITALLRWRDRILATPYPLDNGKPREFDRILIDAGYRDTAIFEFCKQVAGPFRPSKGFGEGYRSSPFHAPSRNTIDKRLGQHWYESRLRRYGLWLTGMDADFWKRFTHDRFLTPTLNDDLSIRRGSLSLWGNDAGVHRRFSEHIVAEIQEEEFVPGKGARRVWKRISKFNHYFDCIYGNCVAGNMCGVRLDDLVIPITQGTTWPNTNWFATLKRGRRAAG
jgi:hypothetical protein